MKWLLIFLLLLPLASADSSIFITLNADGSVLEEFSLEVNSNAYYDSFEFFTDEPLSVAYDGEYLIQDDKIVFFQEITPGIQTLEFSLFYEDLIINDGSRNAFSTNFEIDSPTIVKVSLPKGASIIGNTNALVSTDGERIFLEESFNNNPSISVFYDLPSNNYAFFIYSLIILVIIAAIVTFTISKKVVKNIVEETLSSEELKVIGSLREGITKQKDIAKKLEFSKSKMSKVVRKLEEKGLIVKEPHFKTYIIKLKKIK